MDGCTSYCVCNNCNNNTATCCEYCKNHSINCGNNCGSNNNTNNSGNNEGNSGNNGNNDDNTENKVVVYDSDTEYSSNTPLNIFTQTAYYVVEDKIAPTSENTYQFVIKNSNNFNIKYNIQAMETNKYNINMKYRLKQNGDYVLGNDNEYVTADEIEQYNIGLAGNTYDVYTLDWKWFESSNDTEIGEDISSYYKLNLKVTAIED